MVGADGNNLVLLLSTPRSGSSLATAMLQNHGKLFATQEMWFLMSLLELKSARKRPYGGGAILERFYNGVLPEEAFESACRSFALRVYNGLLGSGAAEMVIDKTPRYYGALEFLDGLFPRSRRIWLLRNPFAVLASYKKLGAARGGSSDLEAMLAGSAFDLKAADLTVGLLRYMRYFSREEEPLAYRLRYERLVADPRAELAEVCRFLGTEYEEGMEKYGDRMDSPKAGLYYSMGVGDPFVAEHSAPHEDSVHAWKELLTKREIAAYGRLLGARLFAELGYGEELEEAERLADIRFDPEPDGAWMALRSKQWTEATGFRWTENYRMRTELSASSETAFAEFLEPAGSGEGERGLYRDRSNTADSETLQLRRTVQALEQRLEKGLQEQKRLRSQLASMKRKADWLKAAIPFGSRLSRLASSYMVGSGGKK